MQLLLSLIVYLPLPTLAQSTPHADEKVTLQFQPKDVLRAQLLQYNGTDQQREQTLKRMFTSAGCGASLQEQPVKKATQNLICVLPGETPEIILIGAHYDHVAAGDGVVDNWAGASMLPILFEDLSHTSHRKHTLVFLGFSGEEDGLVGSRAYVKGQSQAELAKIGAVLIIDTLGLGPTEVWVNRSNQGLLQGLFGTATLMSLPLSGMNVDQIGESDEEAFIPKHIPTITVHSLTTQTLPILHSKRDNMSALKMDDYYNSYKLLRGYLTVLDRSLEKLLTKKAS